MSDTLSGFKTRIRRYLKEPNPDSSYWSDDFITQMFNGTYLLRSSQLIMAHEGWFKSVATRDIEAEQDRYAFPEGHQRTEKIELVRSDGRTVPIARWERHEAVNPTATAVGDLYKPTYRPIGNGFVLEPAPLEVAAGGLRIEYVGLPIALSADGDTLHPSWPTIFEELLVLDTVIAALDAEGMQESGQVRTIFRQRERWDLRFERFIDQRMISRTGVEPFTPHFGDA